MFKNDIFKLSMKRFCKKVFSLDDLQNYQPNDIRAFLQDIKNNQYKTKVEVLNKYEFKRVDQFIPLILQKFTSLEEQKRQITTSLIDENLFSGLIEKAFKKKKLESENATKQLFKETKLEELGENIPYHDTPFKQKDKYVTDRIEETIKEFDKGLDKLKNQAFVEDSFFDTDIFDKIVEDSLKTANINNDTEYFSDDPERKVNVRSIINEANKSVNQLIYNEVPQLEEKQETHCLEEQVDNKNSEFTKYLKRLKNKDNNFVLTKTIFFDTDKVI
jgi:hypothetical protein